jgi:hypothetical protein
VGSFKKNSNKTVIFEKQNLSCNSNIVPQTDCAEQGSVSERTVVQVQPQNNSYTCNSKSEKAQDPIRLISQAIDIWAENHSMQNLPKDIVFSQALAIMNGMNDALKANRDN